MNLNSSVEDLQYHTQPFVYIHVWHFIVTLMCLLSCCVVEVFCCNDVPDAGSQQDSLGRWTPLWLHHFRGDFSILPVAGASTALVFSFWSWINFLYVLWHVEVLWILRERGFSVLQCEFQFIVHQNSSSCLCWSSFFCHLCVGAKTCWLLFLICLLC